MYPLLLKLVPIWAISFIFLFLLFSFKNGNKQRAASLFFRNGKRRQKEKARYVNEFLARLKKRSSRPRWALVFFPLVIMLIVVYLLLSNYVYMAVVTSDSMSPTFKKGDLVLMTKEVRLEEGDIVIFEAPKQATPILHRVVEIKNDNLTTKGDFYPVEDKWNVKRDDIYGEAITVNGAPIVLKGVGTYFIDDQYPGHGYQGEVEYTRLFLSTMKNWAVAIFLISVILYISLSVMDERRR